MLTDKQLKDVCLHGIYASSCAVQDKCRYCEFTPTGYNCLKLSSEARKIDDDCDEWLRKCIEAGKDPSTIPMFMGDNCQGYLYLPNIKQGI